MTIKSWFFASFHDRHFENGLWGAKHPQVATVNIIICYRCTFKSRNSVGKGSWRIWRMVYQLIWNHELFLAATLDLGALMMSKQILTKFIFTLKNIYPKINFVYLWWLKLSYGISDSLLMGIFRGGHLESGHFDMISRLWRNNLSERQWRKKSITKRLVSENPGFLLITDYVRWMYSPNMFRIIGPEK